MFLDQEDDNKKMIYAVLRYAVLCNFVMDHERL